MRYVQVVDERTGDVLATRAGWYASLWRRFQGLMLRRALPDGEGIVLTPCNSVHMALMRFAIDVVFFDRHNRVVKLSRNLRPYRVAFGGRGAHAAVELPAGSLHARDVQRGDQLRFEEVGLPG